MFQTIDVLLNGVKELPRRLCGTGRFTRQIECPYYAKLTERASFSRTRGCARLSPLEDLLRVLPHQKGGEEVNIYLYVLFG